MRAPETTAPAGADDAARPTHGDDDLAQLPPVLDPREEREPVVENITPSPLGGDARSARLAQAAQAVAALQALHATRDPQLSAVRGASADRALADACASVRQFVFAHEGTGA